MPSHWIIILLGMTSLSMAHAQTTDFGTLVPISTDITTFVMTTEYEIISTEITTITEAPPTKPGPTPCSSARWLVRDGKKDICVLMDFDGNFTYLNTTVTIPEKTSVRPSTCSADKAKFELFFRGAGYIWELDLSFRVDGGKYSMYSVAMQLYTGNGSLLQFASEDQKFFTAPNGYHISCGFLGVDLGDFNVNLSSLKLQPFVQRTKGACGLGEAAECGAPTGDGGSRATLVVGLLIAVIVFGAALGLTIYVLRKKKRDNYRYINITQNP